MSLRLRLSITYSALVGVVLLLFGFLVFSIVSQVLLEQIDSRLGQSANQIIERLRVSANNQFDIRQLSAYQPTENLIFQVWDTDRRLQFSRPVGLTDPLDDAGVRLGQVFYSSQTINGVRVRVLSVPLRTNRGPVGYLQVGLSLALVEITQNTLASVLIALTITLMAAVLVTTWALTGEALAQLETVTQVATQITQADDLSRRIPVAPTAQDEVSRLIRAFNQTLERLEKLFDTQRRFLADVSHELRTPLTVIKGEVGLMRLTNELDEESLRNIEKEVDRLTRLVGDLLLLAQAESGQLPLDLKPVELDTILLEVLQQMQILASGKVNLRLEEIDQVMVRGDRDRLKQVILNLVANAINYTPAGGEVRLSLSKQGGQSCLKVEDTGPGIPPEDLPHIFDRFYRGDPSRKRTENSGFGLGLSIAKWIVDHHGGQIEVESQVGKGTRFTVGLPLAE
ncbi:MAG: two-component sensor histidine kinase [Bellilinea sp.]|nr:MAG: two-component sensor histidine kinase [Bellilinea sp.]GIV65585.1 MAG: two-component sensor histidine kinase [Bellilinea sp.]